jgi:hypothetical protein
MDSVASTKPEILDNGVRVKGWEITSHKGPILASRCKANGCNDSCDYCRYNSAIK